MSVRDQTIAISGIFQALRLLQSIAYKGMLDMDYYRVCVRSIMTLDADSTLAVYGGDIRNLKPGLDVLISSFGEVDKSPKNLEVTKYLINILVLEKKLANEHELLEQIKSGVMRAQAQLEHFEIGDENIDKILARTYKQTISTITPRIMVNGEHEYLNNPAQADRIRTLLLAAVRSAVLWRQKDGSRWRLVFKRRILVDTANNLMRSI